ncbi:MULTISPECIES: hypothetical protein [unclassified Mycolicibacterium]|uniref:hypothetical protein n=1 Tax=unclassified Mycolicibacterium TaxID=2636767 RepID=UPI0012DC0BB3|nr:MULTISPECIES: hypothetical protein [unclassified Mycolicibacterium]MUM25689.1 hypothetical protein [Mycolicibacterium sp. CBMA 295]MUL82989.1 hypothetical protein [Mycolicibacterium sp. CBMA 329]MUL89324.1 hypothetical protein [Mycolicibacterium sp. CBMA 331]MUM38840.1 hypothetical protein [Mycolicibacterium sp. CBMA 247]MUM45388.1 hypothetical protein [Mycolicibacterium sp. CBMA 294]
MTTNAAGSTVIELATHPVWCSSRQYSRELAEARRRHPSSYRPDTEDDVPDPDSQGSSNQRTNARVITLACVRGARLNAARSAAAAD